jgi:hypothetical protein
MTKEVVDVRIAAGPDPENLNALIHTYVKNGFYPQGDIFFYQPPESKYTKLSYMAIKMVKYGFTNKEKEYISIINELTERLKKSVKTIDDLSKTIENKEKKIKDKASNESAELLKQFYPNYSVENAKELEKRPYSPNECKQYVFLICQQYDISLDQLIMAMGWGYSENRNANICRDYYNNPNNIKLKDIATKYYLSGAMISNVKKKFAQKIQEKYTKKRKLLEELIGNAKNPGNETND